MSFKDKEHKTKNLEKQKIEGIVSNMLEGVIITDHAGNIQIINAQAKVILGFSPGQEITSRLLEEKLVVFGLHEKFKWSQLHKDSTSKEVINPQEEGQILECSINVIDDDRGGILAIVIILRDVTKEKEIDKMKTEFISTVSHELRTPLSIAKEGISLIVDRIPGKINDKQDRILSAAKDNIDRLARIINSLLDISRIEVGRLEVVKDIVHLNDLLERVILAFRDKVKKKGLQFKINLPKQAVDVYCDVDKIMQVFINLIGNAIKFTEKGSIEILTKIDDNKVECMVSDTGLGISQENLAMVFNKFQQFDRLAGAGDKGTGLGLSIAKGIIDLHHGGIWVESERGKGSKFFFTLPIYSAEAVLRDDLEQRILEARKEHREVSIFIIRLLDCEYIKKQYSEEKFKQIISNVLKVLKQSIRVGETAILRNHNEIVVLSGIDLYNAPKMNQRIMRITKQTIFEITQECKVEFLYGFSNYPNEVNNLRELLEKVEAKLVSERVERFKKRIMIVDDQVITVDAIERILSKLGYSNIVGISDSAQGLIEVKREIPDLIILDLKMQEMDGYSMVGRIKEDIRTKDIPILIISGYKVEVDKLSEYTKEKAIPMLSKPIDPQQLEKLVGYLL